MNILKTAAHKLSLNLSKRQLEQFEEYYQELVEWNRRMNLTSVTGHDDVLITHFLDSLTVIPELHNITADKALRIIDVGSGAGFPGIPLRIALTDIRLTLLESTMKKVRFLSHVTDKLGLDNVEIITGRAENLARDKQYRESFDIVLSRALAPLSVLVELTMPLCKIGGQVIALKKGDIREEISAANKAIVALGGESREIQPVQIEEFTDNRCLVIINKIWETPDKYPRRPGIPAKRPVS